MDLEVYIRILKWAYSRVFEARSRKEELKAAFYCNVAQKCHVKGCQIGVESKRDTASRRAKREGWSRSKNCRRDVIYERILTRDPSASLKGKEREGWVHLCSSPGREEWLAQRTTKSSRELKLHHLLENKVWLLLEVKGSSPQLQKLVQIVTKRI